ncbi:MAG: trigger factor [Myxococcales bacterium]|nr:trigger factor [Myxococcales bacterium]
MKATIEKAEGVHREVRVEIPWSTVKDEMDRALRELAKGLALPGFRKGKVPLPVVRQRYGRQVSEDAVAHLMQDALEAALVQNKLRPVSRVEISRGDLQEGQPYAFTARFEVRPDIEIKEYKGLQEEKGVAQVKPEDVDREIDRLREEHASLVPVEGRDTAAKDDVAVIDYRASRNGRPLKGGERQGYLLHIGAGKALPGFEEHVGGMRVGEEREFDLEFPRDASDSELAGQVVHFSVRLVALKRREIPALTDEFVLDLGDAALATVADLRGRIEKTLLAREDARLAEEQREKLIGKLIERNPFPVPPSMVERQQQAYLAEMEALLGQGGGLERLGMTREKLLGDLRERAERSVRGNLLLLAVAEKEKITVEDADVEEHLAQLAERLGQNLAQVKARFAEGDAREELRYRLLRDKVLEYLLHSSNMPPQAPPPAAGAPA